VQSNVQAQGETLVLAVQETEVIAVDVAYQGSYQQARKSKVNMDRVAPFPVLTVNGVPENDSLFEIALNRIVTKDNVSVDTVYALGSKVEQFLRAGSFPAFYFLQSREPFFVNYRVKLKGDEAKIKKMQVKFGNTWPVSPDHKVPLMLEESFSSKLGEPQTILAYREILYRWRAAYPQLYENAPNDVKKMFEASEYDFNDMALQYSEAYKKSK